MGKMRNLFLLLLAGLVISQVSSEDPRTPLTESGEVEENHSHSEESEADNEIPVEEGERDPCEGKKCGPGKECRPMEKGRAKCVCIEKCPNEGDNRRHVCSNYNETWTSDCELYRARCQCVQNMDECTNELNKHLHIDYYGECRDMPPCTPEEMDDFPRRMRDWLFNIFREMADRRELSPYYQELEREAEKTVNISQRAAYAAVWKYCDLDGHPHDRVVSRHELFPIRAPLLALEHCIAPFLDSCDADNDHRVTLDEWAICLQVDIAEMDLKCDELRDIPENQVVEEDEDEEPF